MCVCVCVCVHIELNHSQNLTQHCKPTTLQLKPIVKFFFFKERAENMLRGRSSGQGTLRRLGWSGCALGLDHCGLGGAGRRPHHRASRLV